jgi:zinc protease
VHSDTPTLNLIQALLTRGRSSRLVRALVDTGIASTVETYDFEDKDPSLFVITANMQKGKSAAQAETVVLRELARLAKQPITPEELSRAKNKVSFTFYESLNSNSERANFLGHYEAVAGDFTAGLRLMRKLETVTPEEIQAVARRYLDPKNRTVITGVKK